MRRKQKIERCVSLILDWILGTLGVIGSLYCLITAFELPEPDLFFIPFLMLGFIIAFRLKKGAWIAGGVGLLLLLIAFSCRSELIKSYTVLWHELAAHYAKGYTFFRDLVPKLGRAVIDAPNALNPALLSLGVFEIYVVAVSLSCWKRAWPACLCILLGVIPCYVLTDTFPSTTYLLIAVFVFLVLVLVQNVRRRKIGELSMAIGWTVGAAGLLVAAALFFFPFEKTFTPPVTWQSLYEKLQSIGEKVENQGTVSAGLTGNPEDVELHELSALPNRPVTVMSVRTEHSGLLYLRGASYNRFVNDVWIRDDTPEPSLGEVFPLLGSRMGWELRIQPKSGERLFFTPYIPTELPARAELVSDSYLYNPAPLDAYALRFTDPDDGSVRSSVGAEYASYIRRYCLDLPERTRRSVLEWWRENGGGLSLDADASRESLDAFVRQVAGKVSACAVYSRSPERAPEDEDFCSWFLESAETGYCVHYASACTALLRALGVPARYVSGYICHPVSGTDVNVTTLQAHAWVEYFDGSVWRMAEPTPGDATEFTGRLPAGESYEDETEETDWVRPTRRPIRNDPTESSDEAPVTEKPTEPDGGSESGLPGGNGGSGGFPAWAWVLIGAALLAALLILRRKLADRMRQQKLDRAVGTNEKAILLYRRCERLYKLSWLPLPPEAKILGEKAAFSQHELSEEELGFLRQCVDRQLSALDRASLFKRFYHRYILAAL